MSFKTLYIFKLYRKHTKFNHQINEFQTQNKQKPLTIGELSTPYYKVQYLDRLGKLPKVKETTGKGDPSIFAPEAVQIVLDHINRNK